MTQPEISAKEQAEQLGIPVSVVEAWRREEQVSGNGRRFITRRSREEVLRLLNDED